MSGNFVEKWSIFVKIPGNPEIAKVGFTDDFDDFSTFFGHFRGRRAGGVFAGFLGGVNRGYRAERGPKIRGNFDQKWSLFKKIPGNFGDFSGNSGDFGAKNPDFRKSREPAGVNGKRRKNRVFPSSQLAGVHFGGSKKPEKSGFSAFLGPKKRNPPQTFDF